MREYKLRDKNGNLQFSDVFHLPDIVLKGSIPDGIFEYAAIFRDCDNQKVLQVLGERLIGLLSDCQEVNASCNNALVDRDRKIEALKQENRRLFIPPRRNPKARKRQAITPKAPEWGSLIFK